MDGNTKTCADAFVTYGEQRIGCDKISSNVSTCVSTCEQCGSTFRQVWKPECGEYTSFSKCPDCRMDNAIGDKKYSTVLDILELVGNKGLTIGEIKEILRDATYEFERTLDEMVIHNAKRVKYP